MPSAVCSLGLCSCNLEHNPAVKLQLKQITFPNPLLLFWFNVTGRSLEHHQAVRPSFFESKCWAAEREHAVRHKGVQVEQAAAGHLTRTAQMCEYISLVT